MVGISKFFKFVKYLFFYNLFWQNKLYWNIFFSTIRTKSSIFVIKVESCESRSWLDKNYASYVFNQKKYNINELNVKFWFEFWIQIFWMLGWILHKLFDSAYFMKFEFKTIIYYSFKRQVNQFIFIFFSLH